MTFEVIKIVKINIYTNPITIDEHNFNIHFYSLLVIVFNTTLLKKYLLKLRLK